MSRLSENVLRQAPGQSLVELLQREAPDAMRLPRPACRHRFLHLVNPYSCGAGSEADRTQRLTFATMSQARELAEDRVAVAVRAVCFPEEERYARQFFEDVRFLNRSVLDVAQFRVPRKLPLLFDVLAAAAAGPADYCIFTNVDICLVPWFYQFVAALVDLGFDAVTVNRRTLRHYSWEQGLGPLHLVEMGELHPGFDCFIFAADLVRQLQRTDSCIGAGWVMRSLLYNLVAASRNMLMLTDCHATYHLGRDEAWNRPELQDYIDFNMRQAQAVLNHHARDPERRARLRSFCANHPEPLQVDGPVAPPRPVEVHEAEPPVGWGGRAVRQLKALVKRHPRAAAVLRRWVKRAG